MKYIICTYNHEWVEATNSPRGIGSKVRKLMNRGYKRKSIRVYEEK